jgi:hypothetical protein
MSPRTVVSEEAGGEVDETHGVSEALHHLAFHRLESAGEDQSVASAVGRTKRQRHA